MVRNYDGSNRLYTILAANTNPFYVGDFGDPVADGDATRGIPAITLAAAGAVANGVIVAVGTIPTADPRQSSKPESELSPNGRTGGQLLRCRRRRSNVIFEIQEGGAGTNLTSPLEPQRNIVYAAPATGRGC